MCPPRLGLVFQTQGLKRSQSNEYAARIQNQLWTWRLITNTRCANGQVGYKPQGTEIQQKQHEDYNNFESTATMLDQLEYRSSAFYLPAKLEVAFLYGW